MTRGTFYLITNDKLYSSTEWNGDMYPTGHGKVAKEMLEKVNSIEDFKKMAELFNKQEGFNYQGEDLVFENPISVLDKWSDFNYKYFELQAEFCWFSDWLFIKNISDREWIFTYVPRDNEDAKDITLKPGELLISNFGHKASREDTDALEGRTTK